VHIRRTSTAKLARYPAGKIPKTLDRRSEGSVRNTMSLLWREKAVHREAGWYVLTQTGLREASDVVREHAD
jgi:hypothetical protein